MPSQPMKADILLSKDVSKRKKLNRSAKMKQIKLDVRREQWLAQVKISEKSGQIEQTETTTEKDVNGILEKVELSTKVATSSSQTQVLQGSVEGSFVTEKDSAEVLDNPGIGYSAETVDAAKVCMQTDTQCYSSKDALNQAEGSGNEELLERKVYESTKRFIFAEQHSKVDALNPHGSFGVTDERVTLHGGSFSERYEVDEDSGFAFKLKSDMLNDWFGGETSPCISRSSTNGDSSYMESTSDDEENASKEDDWEAVADAFEKQVTVTKEEYIEKGKVLKGGKSPSREEEIKKPSAFSSLASESQPCLLKPDYTNKLNTFSPRVKSDGARGWRINDISLPPVPPKLLKQQSAPLQPMISAWVPPPTKKAWRSLAPSECPICTEELDITDACFSPCTCGFQLCLFCHHKIAQDDGRCPGCRKAYKMKPTSKSSS